MNSPAQPRPLGVADIGRLQALLDALPAPLEPLDTSMLDGFLCGVMLQPQPVPAERWLPFVTDADGRPVPAGADVAPLHALLRRRHAELAAAIEDRQWFDPWVFELDDADEPAADGHPGRDDPDVGDGSEAPNPASQAVYPWVAGFALAMEHFPALLSLDAKALTPPLALLYRHLDADDLEDADDLLDEIDSLEPPDELADAVEELVRATLLLADISRPRTQRARPARAPQARRPTRTARR